MLLTSKLFKDPVLAPNLKKKNGFTCTEIFVNQILMQYMLFSLSHYYLLIYFWNLNLSYRKKN